MSGALALVTMPLVLAGLLLTPAGPGARDERPLFRFGIVADVQYADKTTAGSRRYREAAGHLRACVEDLARQRLAFVANLGDLVDGNGAETETEMRAMLDALRRARAPLRHVVGNHCLTVERPRLLSLLGLRSAYYEFREGAWRFLVLDGMDVSRPAPTHAAAAREADVYLEADPRLALYNGAIGERQLAWLRERLTDAGRHGARVVVFCHHATLPEACHPGLTLWNHEQVERALRESRVVAAYFAGHDHEGGYAERGGLHHVTLPGMVEAPPGSNAYGVVEVYRDRLVLRGTGTVPSRVLHLAPTWAARN